MTDYYGDEFLDPILRCDDCSNLVHREFITKRGCCNHCGNRRLKNVQLLQEEEYRKIEAHTYDFGLKKWEVDSEFLKLFEGMEDE